MDFKIKKLQFNKIQYNSNVNLKKIIISKKYIYFIFSFYVTQNATKFKFPNKIYELNIIIVFSVK